MFGEQFATPEEIVRESFCKVMTGINIPTSVFEALYRDYMLAHTSGNPRGEIKAVEDHLMKIDWQWAEFEYWKTIFDEQKRYPYMWLRGSLPIKPLKSIPKNFRAAAPFFTAAELKKFMKDNHVITKPAPKNRDEIEATLIASKTWKLFQPIMEDKYSILVSAHEQTAKRHLCEILAHTLSMTAYALRDEKQRKKLTFSICRIVAMDGGGCRVEANFCRRWNRGELEGLPPFFPGDRSWLSAKLR